MRYGNKAFKDWFKKANEEVHQFLEKLIPEKIKGAKEELFKYIS